MTNLNSKPGNTAAKNIALLFISIVLILFVVEAGLQIYYSKQSFSSSVYSRQSVNEVYNSRFISHPYLPYAAKPGFQQSYIHKNELHDTFDTTTYSTNTLGFRFSLKPLDKAENEKVIVFLGGSTTWDGPDDSLTWPALLTKELNSYYSNKGIKITQVNLAIDGGNSAQSLTNLMFWGVCFKPDLVISYDGINDFFDLGEYKKTLPDYSDVMKKFDDRIRPFIRHFPSFTHKSILIQLLCNTIDRVKYGDMTIYAQMYQQPPIPNSEWQIPMRESFRRNIRCMRSISEEYNAPFIAAIPHVFHPNKAYVQFSDTVKTYWQNDSVTYINMFDSLPRDKSIYHYDPVHFTLSGLHEVAGVYKKFIVQNNLLKIE